MQVLNSTLRDALDSYQNIYKSNYNHDFGLYVQQAKEVAPDQLKDFMKSKENQYFTCIVSQADGHDYKNVTWMSCPGDTEHHFRVYWVCNDVDGFFNDLE